MVAPEPARASQSKAGTVSPAVAGELISTLAYQSKAGLQSSNNMLGDGMLADENLLRLPLTHSLEGGPLDALLCVVLGLIRLHAIPSSVNSTVNMCDSESLFQHSHIWD